MGSRRSTDTARTRWAGAFDRSATLRVEVSEVGQRRALPRARSSGLLGRRRLSHARCAVGARRRRTIPLVVKPMSTPKDAAAIILLRQDTDAANPEVFWVQRSDKLAFLGGFHAFPGGQIDASDAEIEVKNSPNPQDTDAANPEVFWVQRSDKLAFLGGFHAFPGGQIDASDAEIEVKNSPNP